MIIHENISLLPYNTFQLDVNAQFLIPVEQSEDLAEIFSLQRFKPLPKLILGGGSNILLTGNQRKLVIKNNIQGIELIEENDEFVKVRVGAGEIWHQFVLWCIERGLGGVENLSLIPGSVGAAPMQNIGAYGVELKEVFENLEAVDIKTGLSRVFLKDECQFGYRYSIFKSDIKDKFIITHVTFRLSKKPVYNTSYGGLKQKLEQNGVQELSLKEISQAVIQIRQSKLPDPAVLGNAGSFFKNPLVETPLFEALKAAYPEVPGFKVSESWVKIPAAWLIDQCGWKGKRRGDIGVHEHHALVLVNYGGGLGKELVKLSKMIQKSVHDQFGVELTPEVNII